MKKKLLILVNTLSFFLSHRLEVALAAKDKGYDVQIGYGELGSIKTNILSEKSIDIFCFPLERLSINPLKEMWSLFMIWRIFHKLKPDIVHLVTIKPYLYGGIAARLAGVPCVVSTIAGMGIVLNNNNWRGYFLQKLLIPLFYLAFKHPNQKIVVQNSEDKKFLIKLARVEKKKFLLFQGSGVDISLFTNLKELGGIVTVCFASRLLRNKGVFDFVSAARIIKKSRTKAKFLLAGQLDPGNPISLTDQDLNKIKKEKIVKFISYQKDIPSLFEKSHIICQPSFYGEGLPKVLIEAAAASRVVITTDISGCRDAIIPNKTGLIVPPNDPINLAKAIQQLIKNPKKRQKMGKAGRKLAERKFNIKIIINNHLNMYKDLIKKYEKI